MNHGPLTAAEYEQLQSDLDDYDGLNLLRGLIVAICGTVFLVAAVTGVIVVAVR